MSFFQDLIVSHNELSDLGWPSYLTFDTRPGMEHIAIMVYCEKQGFLASSTPKDKPGHLVRYNVSTWTVEHLFAGQFISDGVRTFSNGNYILAAAAHDRNSQSQSVNLRTIWVLDSDDLSSLYVFDIMPTDSISLLFPWTLTYALSTCKRKLSVLFGNSDADAEHQYSYTYELSQPLEKGICLKSICRGIVLLSVEKDNIHKLPLPKLLRIYLEEI